MHHHKFGIFLPVIFGLIFTGCTSDRYWSKACVTPDEKTIGVVGWFYGGGLIDTETGALVKTADGMFDDVNCYENGDVVAFSSEKVSWLNSDRQTEPALVARGDFRLGSDEVFFLKREKKQIRRTPADDEYVHVNDGPPFLIIRKNGEKIIEENYMKLSPERFEGVGSGDESDFEVKPIKVVSGRKLLAAAGFPVYDLRGIRRDGQQVSKNHWGLFTLDPEKDLVTPLAQSKPVDDSGLLFVLSTRFEISSDESLIAGLFDIEGDPSGNDYYSAVVVYDFPAMREKFRARFEGNCSAEFGFSPDNSLLAVGSEKVCRDPMEERLEVFDLNEKRLLWQTALPGRPISLNFFKDGSLNVVTSNLNAARYGAKNGEVIWQQTY